MIGRIWRGWTTHASADTFEDFVRNQHYPVLLGKPMAGFRGSQLLRLTRPGQTEFKNIMWFDSLDAVRALAGDDIEKPLYLPPASRALLQRFDQRAEHFDVRECREPGP
jgi:hypothetical protein